MDQVAHESTHRTESHVEVDGFRLRYIEAGHGRPVVMLHGAAGLAWTRLHDELASRYRVLALEMPGFGRSPVNLMPQSVQDLARTMEQAAMHLGLDSYALIGTSFGGQVALWQVLQAPQVVDLLVLISPTAVLPEGYVLPPVPSSPAQNMARLQHLLGSGRDPQLEARLGEVQALTLVVFGTDDRVVPPAMGRTYRERLPNCHYVLVYDAGHDIANERPEALANAVIDFLDLRETFIVSRRDGRINP